MLPYEFIIRGYVCSAACGRPTRPASRSAGTRSRAITSSRRSWRSRSSHRPRRAARGPRCQHLDRGDEGRRGRGACRADRGRLPGSSSTDAARMPLKRVSSSPTRSSSSASMRTAVSFWRTRSLHRIPAASGTLRTMKSAFPRRASTSSFARLADREQARRQSRRRRSFRPRSSKNARQVHGVHEAYRRLTGIKSEQQKRLSPKRGAAVFCIVWF